MALVEFHYVELPPPLPSNLTWAGQLNMVKFSQDHFWAILSIFDFFAHVELASPC